MLPSASDGVFLILLAVLSASPLSSRLLNDGGIGWHIRNGDLMWQTHAITRADPFSATMHGKPWYAWEYVFDLIVARLHSWAGLNAVAFFAAAVIALVFALCLRLAVIRGAFLPIAAPLLALAISASSIHFFARPHIFSWLFTLICFQLLESGCDPARARSLWFLPALMLLWVNLHGGFVLGFILLGLYLACDVLGYFAGKDRVLREGHRRRATKLALILALTGIASLINPYGYRLHQHIYGYLSDRWLMNHIDEFRTPNFHGLPQQCFALLLIVSVLSLALVRRKPPLRHVLVILFAAGSGLYAARNLPVASLLLVVLIAPVLSQTCGEGGDNAQLTLRLKNSLAALQAWATRMNFLETRLAGHLWPLGAIVLGVWICAHQGKVGDRQLINANFDSKRFPVQAVDFISSHGAQEPVFSLDSWGGYLIYRLYPRAEVVVDDRHDLYGAAFMKKYLGTVRLIPEWNDLLEEQQVRWVLMPRRSALANMLRELSTWKLVYSDDTAELFHKEN